jgi:hypothetical protein
LQDYEGESGKCWGTHPIREQSAPLVYLNDINSTDWYDELSDPQEDGVRTAIEQIYTYLPRAGRDRRTLKK